jgi:hypothetical protein
MQDNRRQVRGRGLRELRDAPYGWRARAVEVIGALFSEN